MNITLIGMSGVGKSLVGKELSKVIKCDFIDIDEIIERKNNMEKKSWQFFIYPVF